VVDRDVSLTTRIRSWRRAQRSKNEEFRRAVQAANVDRVRGLSDLSDVELIVRDPTIPGARHQMEMQRRLKVAIEASAAETVLGRKAADLATAMIIVLTAVLVALTVVLAVRHRAAAGLPRRPAEGAAAARAHREHQGAHRAPGPDGPAWASGVAVLRRVRDALASGRQP
jgi:hypothetical protein